MSTYDDASLITYPSGYKSGVIYSQKPTDGSGDLTFTRASTATRVNESGLIETVASGVPRIDYTGGGCGKLLLEGQRTNILTYSEEIDNAAWIKSGISVTANASVSPDGTTTMDKIVEDSANTSHFATQTSLTSSTNLVFSTFVKDTGEDRYAILSTNGGGVTNAYLVFDPSVGEITETGAAAANEFVEDYGNGIYRVGFYYDNSAAASLGFLVSISDIPTPSNRLPIYLGDGASGVYIWGAQVEQGSYPTSYIPTAGATATRLADVSATTGMASLINDSEGVLYFSGSLSSFDAAKYITLSDGTNNNRVQITFGTSGQAVMNIVIAGAVEMSESSSLGLLTANNQLKIAFKYKANDFALWLDGSEVASSVIGSTFAPAVLTDLKFALGNGGSPFYGEVQELIVFPTALTDTELATLTTI